MSTQTESQIKHHPDDWSFTSNHHHHVERTVHPVIVELIKWVFLNNILFTFLHLEVKSRVDFLSPATSSAPKKVLHDLIYSQHADPLVPLRQPRQHPRVPLLRSLMMDVASAP